MLIYYARQRRVLLLLLCLPLYNAHHEVSSFVLRINSSYPSFTFSNFLIFPLLVAAALTPMKSRGQQMVLYAYQFISPLNLFLLSSVFEA